MFSVKKLFTESCSLNRFAVFFVAIFAVFAAAGCQMPTDPASVVPVVPVTDIENVPPSLVKKTELDLNQAVVTPANATYRGIVWTVKDQGGTGVAAISGGKATPAAAGTLQLTATIVNGIAVGTPFSKEFTIFVTDDFVPVSGITGVPSALVKGGELDLTTAAVTPPNATNQDIAWIVKDPENTTGVTAISNGKATPSAAGELVLTAVIANGTAEGTPFSREFTITVTDDFVAVSGITGLPSGGAAGAELDLTGVTVTPAEATRQEIAWTVTDAGDTGVTDEDLEDGKATPTAAGTLTLTATVARGISETEDYVKDDITITISGNFVAVSAITGVPETSAVGAELDLTGVTVTPSNATNRTIVWSVIDGGGTGVTTNTLKDDGKDTPTGAGTLKVQALIAGGGAGGEDFEQQFTIEIFAPFVAVTGISGAPTGGAVGVEIDLTKTTVTPGNATYQEIVWAVKAAGTTGVTAITGGKATPAAAGTLTLTATVAKGISETEDYVSRDIVITITDNFEAVTSITGVPQNGAAGTVIDLAVAAVTPNTATNRTITWTVKNAGTTGATISGNKATPTAAGTLQVTATVSKGKSRTEDYTQDFSIAVIQPVTGISGLPPSGLTGFPIDLGAATVTVTPNTATNKTIVWAVKDAGGTDVTISNNKATPATAGTLKLTATIANGLAMGTPYTQEFTINIATFVAVTGITGITGVPASGVVGTPLNLNTVAKVQPDNASFKTIVWTVTNAGGTGISSVPANGTVTANAAGTLQVTAAVKDGKGPGQDYTVTGPYSIIFENPFVAVTNISVPNGVVGTEIDLGKATVTPSNATNKTDITWSLKSAGTTGVTEITGGKATPTAVGTLTVTATVKNGVGPGTNYTKDIAITITLPANFVPVDFIHYLTTTSFHATREFDLTAAKGSGGNTYYPTTPTNSAISWTVKDAGGTGVTDADLEDGKATPAAAGTLILTATVKNGKSPVEDYTEDKTFAIIFTAVTGIQGVPPAGKPDDVIDLSQTVIAPADKSTLSPIVWTVEDAGGTGVSAVPANGQITPTAAGNLKLRATVANGASPGTAYTDVYGIIIAAESVVWLYKVEGGVEKEVEYPIATLDDALNYLKDENNNDVAANDKYVIELKADQSMMPFSSPTAAGKAGIEITLRGYGKERKITWNGKDPAPLFTLNNNATMVLGSNITLDGKNTLIPISSDPGTSGYAMINVKKGHLYIKSGSKITRAQGGSAVSTTSSGPDSGSITLEGGEISGNPLAWSYTTTTWYGSAVYVAPNFTFTMTSGAIKNNGGNGLSITQGATASMEGGEISGHTTPRVPDQYIYFSFIYGCGVRVDGSFALNGGTISGNDTGVYSNSPDFTMSGGTISNNTVGVDVTSERLFTMTGGTIKNDVATASPGIRMMYFGAIILDGPVSIVNNPVAVGVTPLDWGYASGIYLTNKFSAATAIQLDLLEDTLSPITVDGYEGYDGIEPVIKSGSQIDNPGAVTQEQLDKFTPNKVYKSLYDSGTDNELKGSFVLTLDGNGFGAVTWTAD